ncbi:MAG: tetratricopeptide repeat protein [Bacteroidales bacterium]|nr:tetratricopeptide repeat protein [Bacteroidales bacterium]
MNRKLQKIMRYKLIILPAFLVLLQLGSSFAQSELIDSLNTNLTFANDTEKIDILIKLSSLTQNISYQQSINYVTEAKKIAIKLGYQKGIADAINRMGVIYTIDEKYKEAKDCFFEAMKIRQIINDLNGLASSYHNLGLAYFHLSNFDESLNYFNKFLNVSMKLGDNQKIAVGYHNLADFHFRLAHFDQAVDLNKKALEYYKNYSNIKGEIQILWQLGDTYFAMDKISPALETLQKGIDLGIRSGGRENELAIIEQTIGKIYSKIGNYDKAMYHLQNALNYSKKENNDKDIRDIYLLMAQYSDKNKKYQEAYEYHEQYTLLKDSIYSDMNSKRIENHRVRYDTRLKENELKSLYKNMEIELLKVEKRTTFRNYLIGFIIIMLIGISAGYFNLKINKKNQLVIINTNKRLKHTYSKITKSELEHRQLNITKNNFLTVISHDLITPFNSLLGFTELLSEEAETNDREIIRNYSGIIYKSSKELFNLLENMLQWSRALRDKIYYQPELFSIAKTIDNIINILMIQADRKNINITTDIESTLFPYADETLVITIIKNLLDNAIRHTPANGIIEINAKQKNEYIYISVSDEGEKIAREEIAELPESTHVTFDKESVTKTGAELALTVVREFVEKNNGKIFAENKQGKGNIFTFTLPTKKK